ncbi:MAG: hypothetical protein ACW981_07155 [Candidatus Hodarchaeales archaeon]|jgi:hypothetical protein
MNSVKLQPNIDIEITSDEIYELFLLFQSLDEISRSVVMVLTHIYPKKVTGTQLSQLAGYSKQSKYIFKSGVLESLEQERIIEIIRPTKRLLLIQIDTEHSLLIKFAKLCELKGKILSERLLKKLLEEIK